MFGGKKSVATTVGYTDLAFAVIVRVYLLVFVHWCCYQQRHGSLEGVYIVPRRKRLRGGSCQASEEDYK